MTSTKNNDRIGWVNRPAILGGAPLVAKKWPKYNTIGDDEKREVMEVLNSGVLSAFHASPGELFSGGPKVRKLEKEWAERFGVKHAVSMNSATSALFAAVTACDIGPGDEVITDPITMSATAAAILGNGAIPVFADVDPHTMNLDPSAVECCITPRTKAICAVHLAGLPTDMDPILELADQHDLFVLEDNAQAPGATYKGRYTGTIGDVGVFSLNCHKTIQSGEGGIAVTGDDDLALRLQLVRNHGEKVIPALGLGDKWNLLGYNYRMTELEAAVAIHQLRRLDELNGWNIRLAKHLNRRLGAEFDFISPPVPPEGSTHVYYFYPMEYDAEKGGLSLDLFAEAVRAEGVPVWTRYPVMLYRQPIYQNRSAFGDSGFPFGKAWYQGDVSYADGICPVAEALAERSLFIETLVRWPNAEADMDLIVDAIHKVIRFRDDIRDWDRLGRPARFERAAVTEPPREETVSTETQPGKPGKKLAIAPRRVVRDVEDHEQAGPELPLDGRDAAVPPKVTAADPGEQRVVIALGTEPPGGATTLAPVAELLLGRLDVELHMGVAGHAAAIFNERFRTGVAVFAPDETERTVAGGRSFDHAVSEWLDAVKPDVVVTGLVGPQNGLDYALLRAAKTQGISTAAILDAWVHFEDRLHDRETGERFAWLPDRFGVPDFVTALEYAELGVPRDKLQLVGHPLHYDLKRMIPNWREIRDRVRRRLEVDRDMDLVVFFSEPLAAVAISNVSPSPGYDEFDALNVLARGLELFFKRSTCVLAVKEHPRQRSFGDRLQGGEIGGVSVVDITDSNINPLEWALAADAVAGMSSSLLVHSACAGIHTLVIQPGLIRQHDRNPLTRRGLLPNLSTPEDVAAELRRHQDPDKSKLAKIRREFRWKEDSAGNAVRMILDLAREGVHS